MSADQRSDQRAELPAPEFPSAGLGRAGYRATEVDRFVAEVRQALRSPSPTLTPSEVAERQFGVVRLGRGYDLRTVDDYLDRAQARLQERQGGAPAAETAGESVARESFPTVWIYLTALVLAAVIVGVALSQA